MKIAETKLKGIFEIENKIIEDCRGSFVKIFHEEIFLDNGLDADFKESYYSISKKNVLRGMHFQLPPNAHNKLVYVSSGEILDVVVDVRQGSSSFGQCFSTNLSAENTKSLYISKGFAHGFLTLSDSATVVYMTSTVYAPAEDTGVRWDSINFEWGINNPIISERDAALDIIKE